MMRAAATTAVVAGTATAVSGHVAAKQQGKAQQAAEAQAYEQEQAERAQQTLVQEAVPPSPPSATGLSGDAIERLKELAALNEQGVLTDEEFASEKAKILGS